MPAERDSQTSACRSGGAMERPAPQAEALKCEGLSNCLANLTSGRGRGWVIRILIGWIIIAFGVMLGAPFWFDVLDKFMIVRSTVAPTDKAKK